MRIFNLSLIVISLMFTITSNGAVRFCQNLFDKTNAEMLWQRQEKNEPLVLVTKDKQGEKIRIKAQSFVQIEQNRARVFSETQNYKKMADSNPLIQELQTNPKGDHISVTVQIPLYGLIKQEIKIKNLVKNKSLEFQLAEGPLRGLEGSIYYFAESTKLTEIWIQTNGNLSTRQVPFFMTEKLLRWLGEVMLKQLKEKIEQDS